MILARFTAVERGFPNNVRVMGRHQWLSHLSSKVSPKIRELTLTIQPIYPALVDRHPYKPFLTYIVQTFVILHEVGSTMNTKIDLTEFRSCLWMKTVAEIWISKAASHMSGHARATHHHNISLSISTATISHCQNLLSKRLIHNLINMAWLPMATI